MHVYPGIALGLLRSAEMAAPLSPGRHTYQWVPGTNIAEVVTPHSHRAGQARIRSLVAGYPGTSFRSKIPSFVPVLAVDQLQNPSPESPTRSPSRSSKLFLGGRCYLDPAQITQAR
eukprot:1642963-Rhodomonas_salina.1